VVKEVVKASILRAAKRDKQWTIHVLEKVAKENPEVALSITQCARSIDPIMQTTVYASTLSMSVLVVRTTKKPA